jgi:hypothetical protein
MILSMREPKADRGSPVSPKRNTHRRVAQIYGGDSNRVGGGNLQQVTGLCDLKASQKANHLPRHKYPFPVEV